MQLSLLSSTLVLMACEGDVVVSKGTNASAPNTVLISSHAEGESFANGETVVFQAVATDDNNDAAELISRWFGMSGRRRCVDAAPVDDNGMQECSVTLTEGMSSIVAEVRIRVMPRVDLNWHSLSIPI